MDEVTFCLLTFWYLVSEYFRCVCGNINYVPLKQVLQPPLNQSTPNLTTSTQFNSNIQAYGYNYPKSDEDKNKTNA